MALIETNDTNHAFENAVWVKLTIRRDDAGIYFYINDTLVTTHDDTESFPTTAYTLGPTIYHEKTGGGNDLQNQYIDFFSMRVEGVDREVP